MPDRCRFPYLEEAARELDSRAADLVLEELRSLLCRDCDFFDDDHDDELECSCFQMLALLLARGVLTPRTLADAVNGEAAGGEAANSSGG